MNMLKISAVLVLCFAAAACGRKGPLEPPPGSNPSAMSPFLSAIPLNAVHAEEGLKSLSRSMNVAVLRDAAHAASQDERE